MRNKTRTRQGLLLCGAAAVVLATASAAHAAEPARFDIAPQPLSTALAQFGVQSERGVFADSALTERKMTQGVSGAKNAEIALNELLAGTGLAWRREGQSFVIVQGGSGDPQSGSAAGGGATVEALIVTAQKREEDIQDVPIAISAFSQEDLTRSQIAGGPDLVTQVPNMTFTKTNFSSYSVQLRGIGTQAISATTDPAVAVAFNNTPFIRNRFFEQEFYDLQRVEVLRGPQGTLYGRNATAGVVNIISAKPRFNFETKASADLSNYNSSRVEGMINIPIVEDVVALRLAGAWTKRDGYAFNQLTGGPIDGRDLWSTRLSLRVTPNDRLDVNLIWEHFEEDDDRLRSGKQLCKKDVVTNVGDVPITNYYDTSTAGGQSGAVWAGVQAALSQGCKRNSLYARDSFQRPNGLMLPYYVPLGAVGLPAALRDPYVSPILAANPFSIAPNLVDTTIDQIDDLWVIESTIDPQYSAESNLGELQVNFDLTDTLTLTSETAYATDTVYSLQDFNRFNTAPGAWEQPGFGDRPDSLLEGPDGGIFCDPQLGCSDRLVAVDISTATSWQFSQELRLASNYEGAFNFSLGANFMRADSEDKYYVFINSLSLISARGPLFNTLDAYIPNVTDNIDCLTNGYIQGDPNAVYAVTGCQYIDPNPIESVNDEGHNYFLSKNPYKLISYAVFGEAYYQIADNLKVTAGLRWTVDKKEAPRIPTWILGSNSVGYPVAEVIEQEWREPTGRLTIDWKPDLPFTDETLVYASYAHGYKAGGANPPGYVRIFYADPLGAAGDSAASLTRPMVFEPEFIEAYELGSKNTFADGRVTMNLAAFYYDYEGYQVSEIVDRSAFNRNFDTEVWGAEIEADWRPLENLRFGLKGGYQKTRIKDGEEAIDLMDRTAGDPDWLVVRPFPTYASSCILPTYVFVNPDNTIGRVGGVGGGGPSGCEIAYQGGHDPVTDEEYVDLTENAPPPMDGWGNLNSHPDYPGFDPSTAPNGGEGILKPLGGNELPNAPNWTWTITGDYTIPLAGDWLVNLHTDLHWQAESWWRVFNDHEYNKLDEYFTMNLAAIFTNEEAGWNVMAYVKNVTDETAITGAFLNSDDTGLTTNVFLTEPRLYGLRVTKSWWGGPTLGAFGQRREGPFPFTLEVGGQVQRHDAPNATIAPSYASAFTGPLDINGQAQEADLDWGDGRDVKLTFRPSGGLWTVHAGARFGKTNGFSSHSAEQETDPVCFSPDQYTCEYLAQDPKYEIVTAFSMTNHAQARVTDREEHTLVDFGVGRDFGLGGLSRSTVGAGIRYAQLRSDTRTVLRGVPDWELEDGFFYSPYPTPHHVYTGATDARREFEGTGPLLTWDAALRLFDGGGAGQVDIDWSVSGGVLFGKRSVDVTSTEEDIFIERNGFELLLAGYTTPPSPIYHDITTTGFSRSEDSVTAPVAGASLGLSYSIGAFSAGAGYRWERYFDAIDGGFNEAKDVDRTIDGPYFKLSLGFGG